MGERPSKLVERRSLDEMSRVRKAALRRTGSAAGDDPTWRVSRVRTGGSSPQTVVPQSVVEGQGSRAWTPDSPAPVFPGDAPRSRGSAS